MSFFLSTIDRCYKKCTEKPLICYFIKFKEKIFQVIYGELRANIFFAKKCLKFK